MSLNLKPGDTIGITAPARWIGEEAVQAASAIIQSWGLRTVYGKNLFAQTGQFAGEDALRASDLQNFLDDPNINAILCARGGYGTIRIIDQLDFTAFVNRPKWVCGFSDVTILHAHINDKLGLPSIHSCMPVTFSKNSAESLSTLHDALFGKDLAYQLPHHELNQPGSATAEIVGGNLSILYSLLGTRYGFSTAGKILFLEDVDEYLYHIDRMLISLKLGGKFNGLQGIIIGSMSEMKDNKVPFGISAEEIISSHVRDLPIPVCFGFPAGHTDDNRSLIFRKQAELHVSGSGAQLRIRQ